MKINKKILIFIFLQISIFNYSLLYSQINYYSQKNVYLFAENLYQEGDYLRAAGEFQRYMFAHNAQCDSILYKIGLCYELSNEPEIALKYYNKIIDNYPNSKLLDAAHYQIAHTYFSLGKYNESINYINESIRKISLPTSKFKMGLLLGINYLYKREWKTANKQFSSLLNNYTYDGSTVSTLNSLSLKGMQLKYKNRTCAGVLSAIIPGTGKMYTGRFQDGLYSFFVVGLTAWQAYDGFNEKGARSIKGWIYGTLGATFYLGNIYGSVVSVKIHNKKLEDNLINQIDINLIWRQK